MDAFLRSLIEDWQAARPATVAQLRWEGSDDPLSIVADRTLRQALTTVLNR
jgi:hypothetical protein